MSEHLMGVGCGWVEDRDLSLLPEQGLIGSNCTK